MKKKNILPIFVTLLCLNLSIKETASLSFINQEQKIMHNLTASKANANSNVSFVSPGNDNTTITYAAEGIRVSSTQCWSATTFGTFDVTHGIDVKFIAPKVNYEGKEITGVYVEMYLCNELNTNYQVRYRVWTNIDNQDNPTVVYIDSGSGLKEYSDTGWIKKGVDGIDNQFHMKYDVEDTLCGERLGGMQRVDNAYDALASFFENAPSNNFILGFDCGHFNQQSGVFEYIVTEINDQSLKNTSGVMNELNDAYLYVSDIEKDVTLNQTITINAYSKDIFMNTTLNGVITKPNGQTDVITFNNGQTQYTFNELGSYSIKISTTGSSNNEVSKTYDVICKSFLSELVVEIEGSYNSTYDLNSQLTILKASYSENVIKKTITITKPNKEIIEVNEDDVINLDKPGIYTITYTAEDEAVPVANQATKEFQINVPDIVDPVIEVSGLDNIAVDDKVSPTITIIEDSEYDVKVTLIKPNNDIVILQGSQNYQFYATIEGEYTLKVFVEDLYGNQTTINKTFSVVSKASVNNSSSSKGCKGSAIPSLLGLISLAGVLLLKRKNKGE